MLMRSRIRIGSGLGLIAALMAAATAHAQETASQSEAALDAGDGLGDIVVTARKRDERLQDVPISAAIISSENLAQSGKKNLVDLSTSVPNLSYQQSAEGSSFVVRGITTRAVSPGVEDSLGVYVDGVLAGRPAAYNQDLTRAERVEVLRGPQGTLFGKNTMSGAISIVTKKPSDTFEASGSASYGNLNAVKLSGSVEGPLSEGLSAAVSGSYIRRDGYLKNAFDDREFQNENRAGGRFQLRYQGGPLEINFSADIMRERRRAIDGQLLDGRGCLDPGCFTQGIFQPSFARTSPRRADVNGPVASNVDLHGLNLSVDYDLGGGYSITSVTGYRYTKEHIEKDSDATSLDVTNVFRTKVAKQFSEELRLASPTGNAIDFVAGLYYFHQDLDYTGVVTLEPDWQLPPNLTGIDNDGWVKSDSYAAFINGNWHISDQLTLNVGARYTHEKKSALWNQQGVALFSLPTFSVKPRISEGDFSPTVSLSYKPVDEVTAYAKVSRGFKSGGFNLDVVSTPNIAFGAESATAYEIGIKSQPTRNLRFNIAGFYTDYKDIQTYQLTATTGETRNAGTATLKGFEAEVQAQPLRGLEINAGLAYTDARYDRYDNCATGVASCAGNRIFAAPDWTGNGSIQYKGDLSSGGAILARGEVEYRGSAYFDATNIPSSRTPPFTLFNARLGYIAPDERWEIALFGKNLTNKTYEVFRQSFTLLQEFRTIYGEPRTYGVEVRARFR